MAIDLGRVIGPQGERGNRWFTGTGLVGESVANGAIATGSLDEDARLNDFYLNTSTGEVFKCVVAGDVATSRWTYGFTIKGAKFEYEDFTSAQLEQLRGPEGQRGPAFSVDGQGTFAEHFATDLDGTRRDLSHPTLGAYQYIEAEEEPEP